MTRYNLIRSLKKDGLSMVIIGGAAIIITCALLYDLGVFEQQLPNTACNHAIVDKFSNPAEAAAAWRAGDIHCTPTPAFVKIMEAAP